MWKKGDLTHSLSKPSISPNDPVNRLNERALIGASIIIKGDLSGEEDLIIQGRVAGKVSLLEHSVTVGKEGRVKADIFARVISVEGQVEGNLHGEEKIILRENGNVRGNLQAPQVMLEEGCRFKGSIDMESKKTSSQQGVEGKGNSALGGANPKESTSSPVTIEPKGRDVLQTKSPPPKV